MLDLGRHRSSCSCSPRLALSPAEPYPELVDQHTKKKDERTSCSLTWLCMSTSSDTRFFMSLVTILKENCRTERCHHSLITFILFFIPFLALFLSFSCFNHILLHFVLLCISCQMTCTGVWLYISLVCRYCCLVLCWAWTPVSSPPTESDPFLDHMCLARL